MSDIEPDTARTDSDWQIESARATELQEENIAKLKKMVSATYSLVKQSSMKSNSSYSGSLSRRAVSMLNIGTRMRSGKGFKFDPDDTDDEDVKPPISEPARGVDPPPEPDTEVGGDEDGEGGDRGRRSRDRARRGSMRCFRLAEEPRPPSEPPAPSDQELSEESEGDADDADDNSPHLSDSGDEVDIQRPSGVLQRQGSNSMPSTLKSSFSAMNFANLRSPRGLFSSSIPTKLRVFVTTFNTGGVIPSTEEMHHWLPIDSDFLCDIVAIGIQECGTNKSASKADVKAKIARANRELDDLSARTEHKNIEDESNPPSLSRNASGAQLSKKITNQAVRGSKSVRVSLTAERPTLDAISDMFDEQNSNTNDTSPSITSPSLRGPMSPTKPELTNRSSRMDGIKRAFGGRKADDGESEPGTSRSGRSGSKRDLDPEHSEGESARKPSLTRKGSSQSTKKSTSVNSLQRAKSAFSGKKSVIDKMILKHYGPAYKKVAAESLGDMKLIVLCRTGLKPHVTGVKKGHKATGIGGVIGNKGGMMVKLKVNHTDICFLSCHLAAHESEDKVNRRNQDVHDILKATSNMSKQGLDVTQRYHHTFLFGDLNYRINLAIGDKKKRTHEEHRRQVMQLIHERKFDQLYRSDQLVREIKANNVLRGFHENAPKFPPTFKVIPGSALEYQLHRTPSYCDRILWTSLPGLEGQVSQDVFDSVEAVTCSDHKPVYSIFTIHSVAEYSDTIDTHRELLLSPRKQSAASKHLHLRISRLKALNVSDEIYGCQFLSLKFQSPIMSNEQSVSPRPPGEEEHNFLVDMCFDVPEITLRAQTLDQLKGKHLTVSLWGDKKSSKKLMGQCVLSLDSLAVSTSAYIFEVALMRYGVVCGEISGVLEIAEAAELAHTLAPPSGKITKHLSQQFVNRIQSVDLKPPASKAPTAAAPSK